MGTPVSGHLSYTMRPYQKASTPKIQSAPAQGLQHTGPQIFPLPSALISNILCLSGISSSVTPNKGDSPKRPGTTRISPPSGPLSI